MNTQRIKTLFYECFLQGYPHDQIDAYLSIYNESPSKLLNLLLSEHASKLSTTAMTNTTSDLNPVKVFKSLYVPTCRQRLSRNIYKCIYCQKLFKVRSIFRTHKIIHTINKSFKLKSKSVKRK